MKNIPRIFINDDLHTGAIVKISTDTVHYLTRVMRTDNCLIFGSGNEFNATVGSDNKSLIIGEKTAHTDPSGDITLYFAPVKRTDDLLNMATQMGVARFVPVITERTVAQHINWERMKKIVIEASEQSNRNSVPEIMAPVKFSDLDLSEIVFADERTAYGATGKSVTNAKKILIGPEGGFSDAEFAALDAAGGRGITLGKTILRAELAAAITICRVTK